MKRATKSRFGRVDSVPCVVIVCDDGSEVAVPAEIFLALAPRAKQLLNSTNTPVVAGQWVAALYHPVDQIRTGTTDNGRVALQFDPGTESEVLLSLDPQTARDLGQVLVDIPPSDPSLSRVN